MDIFRYNQEFQHESLSSSPITFGGLTRPQTSRFCQTEQTPSPICANFETNLCRLLCQVAQTQSSSCVNFPLSLR